MKNRPISRRSEKAASVIKSALADILKRGKAIDPILSDNPITFTEIIVSPDLKIADCYFFPFKADLNRKEIEEAFERSKYSIRAAVTDKIKLRYSPELRFRYDETFDRTGEVEKLLSAINKN